ncbi:MULTISPECIES: AbrB/MazE/SpoVT family DNA-binding domain-containing protein [Cysteiniphilum]|uniref:AbrB/MazE/SpoVT family DNA-binding domain-containing protein n=1 Tax=Cysteiniphilum TaxID=2056696 RepID=UPI00177BAA29|nr:MULTISPECIES: AbrB/MazE/SpoVT family DNA-binding domain-containing protein [Cysteiniphilum]
MQVYVKKWGNSAAIRLPVSLMKSISIDVDSEVNITEDKGRIIIEPVKKQKYILSDLLAEITEENLQSEIDFGREIGNEKW